MEIHAKVKNWLSRDKAVITLLVILGILIYINCLSNELSWDDNDIILDNRFIKDWSFWHQLLTQNIVQGAHKISNYWRPLSLFLFAIEWHLWAKWVPGWHAVSIMAHIAASIPLFLLIKMLFKNHWLALLTALMFLMHPAQTENVVYPNAIADSLASFFIFLGLLFFTRSWAGKKPVFQDLNYWLALCCYPLALLSRETGILLVAFLVLIIIKDACLLPASTQKNWKAAFFSILPFALIAGGYLLLRATVLNFSNSFNFYNGTNAFTAHVGIRIAVFFQALASYAGILFVPYELRAVRMDQPPEILLSPQTALGLAFFLVLVFLAWHFRRKQPAVTFGISWFFLALLPTSNLIVIINAITHEHFLYIALAGIWLAVFALLLNWAKDEKRQRLLTAGFLLLFIIFGIRVMWRNTDWRTAISFYEKELVSSPQNYRIMNNLGIEYAKKGMLQKAAATYTQTINLNLMNPEAYHNLANLERSSGQTDLAIAHYEKAIAVQPQYLLPYDSLVWLYWHKKEYAKARRVLEQLMIVSTDQIPTLRALIGISLQEGAYEQTRRYLNIFLKLQPASEEAKTLLNQINSSAAGR